MTTLRTPGTAARILDVSERLVQLRGYNAFSYADIAKAVGVRKASLHHHFATKADLGRALVARYRRTFIDALGTIEEETDGALRRLEQYADLYGTMLRKRRMCMCGMLATDAATLPKPVRDGVAEFFAENIAWLTRVLEQGRKRRELRFTGPASAMATFFLSAVEGAMLVAYGSGEYDRFDGAARQLLATVRPEKAKSKRREA